MTLDNKALEAATLILDSLICEQNRDNVSKPHHKQTFFTADFLASKTIQAYLDAYDPWCYDMESAPKDAPVILKGGVSSQDGYYIDAAIDAGEVMAKWDEDDIYGWIICGTLIVSRKDPTAWMHIPKAKS